MPTSLTLAVVPTVSPRLLQRQSSDRISLRRISLSVVATATEAESGKMESRRSTASLYEVLRVEKDASTMEIKSAYRSLAKIYHPDTVVKRLPEYDNGREFIEIRNAYEALSDPSARAMYDLSLMAAHGGRNSRFARPLGMNLSSEFYTTGRWETDQCW
ncbi:hypothetical protein Lal_00016989 [Lupinus albus]|uniref:Putative DnaJ domain-containing protein n=1 Tax=Lupinus albus TaxID=3870 RepID=A0A6A4P3E4_LUPAL|nr:putative DnaJ domain-containing protein [Lupinus albus]KAF1891357.1 hypothetical protein Lal_00016989 [Lupinus albus]